MAGLKGGEGLWHMLDPATVIRADSLVRDFGDERAVDGVSLTVEAGRIHAIVGLNGAGKTTLMRMLLGMVRPTSGTAAIHGVDVARATPGTWRRVGYLIETPFTYPELTIRQNLRTAALLHGTHEADIEQDVDSALDAFGLRRWEGRRSRVLSLGNHQRLGLASAVVHHPDVLILDEPANALDPAGVVFIRDLLRSSAEAGAAILVSSHHLDQLSRVADEITVLHRGRAIGSLDPHGVDIERSFFDLVYTEDMDAGVTW